MDDTWTYDYTELCICGHPGTEHCLDDECICYWNEAKGEYGGACLVSDCESQCCTYRPRSMYREKDDHG